MDLTSLARLAGLLGGLCWFVRMLLDLAGHGTGALVDLLQLAGLALIAVALVGMGAALVSTSATWLRVIVGVALPLLVWSVLEVMHGAADPVRVDGLAGLLVAVASVVGMARRPKKQPPARRRSHGAHAR